MRANKGQMDLVNNFTNVFWIILVIVGVIAVVFGIALMAPIFVGKSTELSGYVSDAFHTGLSTLNDSQNASGIAADTVEGTLGTVQFISYAVFIGLILGYLIICFYIRTQPWLIFLWVFVMIFMVIISMFISNAYVNAATAPNTASFYSAWGTNDFLLRHLPHAMAVLGTLGGILLLVLYPRDEEGGASL